MTRNTSGSMTVFFTLVFMLIFALIGTTIELARFKVCQVHAYRTLKVAEESLFTEYNRPLFDDYKLLFLEEEGKPFEKSVMEYAAPTLNSDKKGNYIDMFDGAMMGAHKQTVTYAGDNNAAPLKNEIKEYMIRRLPVNAWRQFQKKKDTLSEVEADAKKIDLRLAIEKEAAELDVNVLELMKLIDGVTLTRGKITGSEHIFIKMFFIGEKKAQASGISHPSVWKEVKGKMVSIKELIENYPKKSNDFKKYVKDCLTVIKKAVKSAESLASQCRMVEQKQGLKENHFLNLLDGDRKGNDLVKVLKRNQKVLAETIALLAKKEDGTKEKLFAVWQAYDTSSITFNYTGLSESGESKSPKEELAKAIGSNMLNLVLEKPEEISKKKVAQADQFCSLYKVMAEENDYRGQVNGFAKTEKVKLKDVIGNMTGYAYEEFCLDRYIDSFCGDIQQPKGGGDKVLDYECEYILSGKQTDKENLESITNRLVLLRTVINFGAIISNGKHRDTAYAAAAAIVGFTGMEFLIRFTQTVLMIIWAMVESLVDVAALFQGFMIPALKAGKDLAVSFPELLGINRDMIQQKAKGVKGKGLTMGYGDYLNIFLLCMKSSVRLYRLMDLIQWNMVKNHNSSFQLATMVYSLEMEGEFWFQIKFFRLPVLESLLQMRIYQFDSSVVAANTY